MSSTVRRNGNRAACEPCRKSKLRCDHGKPPCGRCQRRGLSAQQCQYHPAPMTQRAATQPQTPMSISPLTTPRSAPWAMWDPESDIDRSTSVVGMHSSMVEFEDPGTGTASRTYTALTKTGVAMPSSILSIDPRLLRDGAETLEQIYTLTQVPNTIAIWLLDREEDQCALGDNFILTAATKATVHAFRELGPNPTKDNFRAMSRAIFEQTANAFKFPQSQADDAIVKCMSVPMLRWETVGMFAVPVGLRFAAYNGSDKSINPRMLAQQCFEVALKCQAFCQQLGQINDLSLWLGFKLHMLATWCHGDDSYLAWRIGGDVASNAIALNLHRGCGNDPSVPQYVVEIRRRMMALMQESDKAAATFVGRPPRLPRHFCVVELPLDIPELALVTSPEVMEEAMAELGPDGWNTRGRITAATRLRAQVLIVPIREEVLELSMSTNPFRVTEQARDLLRRLETVWQSIPLSKYTDQTLENYGFTGDSSDVIRWVWHDYLYTKFLLHKLLVSLGDGKHAELIQVSHDLLTRILNSIRDRNAVVLHRLDSEFIMVYYAMPCASLLLLELYRLTRQPEPGLVLHRSTIIKDISALVACCDWVAAPGQANFDLCKRARALFSRGLDRVLDEIYTAPVARNDASLTPTASAMPANGAGRHDLTDDFAQDPAWTAWLESFGLEGDQWLDLSLDNNAQEIV